MNTNCQGCGGIGYISIRNGDDDQPCKLCDGINSPSSPAPIEVTIWPYKATVTTRNGLVHISNTFIGKSEPLDNSFISPELPLAIGRALVLACRPAVSHNIWIGWDYRLSEISKCGWLVFKGHRYGFLPDTLVETSAYELGVAFVQMGAIMQMRNELATFLGGLTIEQMKAAV